jgi:hypothetical protein
MQHYTHTHAIQNATHYDGLSGPVEDLMAVAVKGAASQAPTVEEAFNLFRFNKAKIEHPEALARVNAHDVTPAFNVAYEAIKPFVVPFAAFTAPKDMKPDEKLKVHADLFNKFKDAYKKIAPPKASTPPTAPTFTVPKRGALINLTSRFPSGTASSQGTTPSAFPIVPVAIAAAGLVAVLLMRKK